MFYGWAPFKVTSAFRRYFTLDTNHVQIPVNGNMTRTSFSKDEHDQLKLAGQSRRACEIRSVARLVVASSIYYSTSVALIVRWDTT